MALALEKAEARWGSTARVLCFRVKLAALTGATDEMVEAARLAALLEPENLNVELVYGVAQIRRGRGLGNPLEMVAGMETILTVSTKAALQPEMWATLAKASEGIPAPAASEQFWVNAGVEGQREAARVRQWRQERRKAADAGEGAPLAALLIRGLSGDDKELVALRRLAGELARKQGDMMLEDLLRKGGVGAALTRLMQAIRASESGNSSEAMEEGKISSRMFGRAGMVAGRELANLYVLQGLRRAGAAGQCGATAQRSLASIAGRKYHWLEIRIELVALACESIQRNSAVLEKREMLAARMIKSGYAELEVGGMSGPAQPFQAVTSPGRAWTVGHAGLEKYWKSVLPGQYAVSFYVPLGLNASQLGYPRVAELMFQEALNGLEGSSNGWLQEAIKSDYRRISRGKRGIATAEGMDGKLDAAQVALGGGQFATAEALLKEVTGGSRFPHSALAPEMWLSVMQLLGEAYWKQGNRVAAVECIQAILDRVRQQAAQTRDFRQRRGYLQESERAWRLMVEMEIEMAGAATALKTWREFRRGAVPETKERQDADATTAWLWVGELPSGPVVFLSDRQGVAVLRLSRGKSGDEATRFSALVANPMSPEKLLLAMGRNLYDALLKPFEGRLAGTTQLVVDSEGDFSGVPWAAMIDQHGRSLLERFAEVQAVSIERAAPEIREIGWEPALLVANPELGPDMLARFPRLIHGEREVRLIGERLRDKVLLEGVAATQNALRPVLTGARLFHFAGHGIANGTGAGLLLSTDDRAGIDLLTANELAALDLSKLRLAVLAACSTADGAALGIVNVESLVYGFLAGGTHEVMAARWNVDSESAELMLKAFYGELFRGKNPAEALRKSVVSLRNGSPWRHPFYWSGYQLFRPGK